MDPEDTRLTIANGESMSIEYTYDEDGPGTVTMRSKHTGTVLARGPISITTNVSYDPLAGTFVRKHWPYGTVVRDKTGRKYMVIGPSPHQMWDLDVIDLETGEDNSINYAHHEVVE